MRVSARWKLLLCGLAALPLLSACPTPPRAPAPPPQTTAPAPHVGTPYVIAPAASLLTILVYRAGTLASAGHNHVIASHELAGTIWLPAEPLRSSFEVQLPVDTLTVDEADLRAAQHSADFPPDVPDGAKEGTRRNMLGAALLDAANNPQIVLRALSLSAGSEAGTVQAHVQSTVRAQQREFDAPVHYQLNGDTLTVSGEFALRQSELGLTPFSAMLGALQVQDEMHLTFRMVAHPLPGPTHN
jgi:polyisoprenoid-binding protein YceI